MKEKLITTRIDEETLANWDKFCLSREISRSNLIRLAVNDFILSTSKEDMEVLIDKLLVNYTKSFSKRIVSGLSSAMKREFDDLRDLLAEKNPTN